MVMRARLVANPPLLAAFLRFAPGMPGLLPDIREECVRWAYSRSRVNHISRRILISPIFWRWEFIRWEGVTHILKDDQSEARSRDQGPVPITFWQLLHDQTGPIRGRCPSHVITNSQSEARSRDQVPVPITFWQLSHCRPTYLKSCVIKQFRPAA